MKFMAPSQISCSTGIWNLLYKTTIFNNASIFFRFFSSLFYFLVHNSYTAFWNYTKFRERTKVLESQAPSSLNGFSLCKFSNFRSFACKVVQSKSNTLYYSFSRIHITWELSIYTYLLQLSIITSSGLELNHEGRFLTKEHLRIGTRKQVLTDLGNSKHWNNGKKQKFFTFVKRMESARLVPIVQ